MRLTCACALAFLFTVPACGDDEEPEDTSCFSPTQNLEGAYAEGAVGCRCRPDVDEGVCVADPSGRQVGLICGEDGRWWAVNDGPCVPQP